MPLPLLPSLPPLPPPSKVEEYVATFFSRIHPIHPVLDQDMFYDSIEDLRSKLEAHPSALDSRDYPALACSYAVFGIAADELEGQPTELGKYYLEGAYFLYAHLVAIPYVTSVQALLLLTVALKNRNKDGASWETLGQAIRIAQSIGLHRHDWAMHRGSNLMNADSTDATQMEDLHSRIWWTAYILERAMELETGRPSAIRDSDCNQILPQPVLPPQSTDLSFDYFAALIGLARIQNSINDLYRPRPHRRRTKDLLHQMGRLDRSLQDWAAGFPEEIRPGRDVFCPSEEYHLATYITLHYHQTVIALHRPALMSATSWLRNRVTHLCAGTPWKNRLRYCLCIGAASGRSILKAWSDLLMYSKPSLLITLNQATLAILVLAMYVIRIPSSRMKDSDLAMVVTFTEEVEREYLRMGQDEEFINGLVALRRQLVEHVSSTKSQNKVGPHVAEAPSAIHQHYYTSEAAYDFATELDLSMLDDAWPSVWTNDLDGFYMDDPDQDMNI